MPSYLLLFLFVAPFRFPTSLYSSARSGGALAGGRAMLLALASLRVRGANSPEEKRLCSFIAPRAKCATNPWSSGPRTRAGLCLGLAPPCAAPATGRSSRACAPRTSSSASAALHLLSCLNSSSSSSLVGGLSWAEVLRAGFGRGDEAALGDEGTRG